MLDLAAEEKGDISQTLKGRVLVKRENWFIGILAWGNTVTGESNLPNRVISHCPVLMGTPLARVLVASFWRRSGGTPWSTVLLNFDNPAGSSPVWPTRHMHNSSLLLYILTTKCKTAQISYLYTKDCPMWSFLQEQFPLTVYKCVIYVQFDQHFNRNHVGESLGHSTWAINQHI